MKIAVLFNCQGQGVAAALRAMLPDAAVDYFSVAQPKDSDGTRADAAAALAGYDVVFSHQLGAGHGPLASARLRQSVAQFHTLPGIGFRGFHPDQIYVLTRDGTLPGATGDYHSRLAVAGFLGGLSASETAVLYSKLAFARLGYLDTHAQDFALLGEQLGGYGEAGARVLAALRDGGCFMHSCNHPKRAALTHIARLACSLIDVAVPDIDEESVQDFLEVHPAHPVFADIAAACGVAPEGMFRHFSFRGQPFSPISAVDFVARSFAAYRDVDRDLLRRADGVREAMAALGLQEPAASAQRPAWQRGMALMTRHGTLLRQSNGVTVHEPLAAASTDAAWLRADLQGDSLGRKVAGLEDVVVRAAPQAGMVALAKGRAFLGADREVPQVYFLRDAAGDAESLLPVSDAQLETLQMLLSGEWARDGAPLPVRAEMAGGPAVSFGAARIDLLEAWPSLLPASEDGLPRLAVRLDGVAAVLRQTVKPPPPQEAVARSVGLGQRVVLAGGVDLLPLPLTLNNADRRWLHTHCGSDDGLPWDSVGPRIVVERGADHRMFGPAPKPGEALSQGAVLEGATVLVSAMDGAENTGWIAPLLRLLTVAPYLEPGTAVIAPGDAAAGRALSEAWEALGLQAWPVVAAPAGLYVAQDVTWMDPAAPAQWPAETLHATRAIALRGAGEGQGRVFVRGPAARGVANWAELETALTAQKFDIIEAGPASPADQLARLRTVGVLVGVGSDLEAAAFCPDGAKVIELTGDDRFDPAAWLLSCRLGMSHAVLPCAAAADGFAVDAGRLMQLIRVMKFRL